MSIKIENIVGPSFAQWEAVVRGMRNPMNSWAKSDSEWKWVEDESPINPDDPGMEFVICDADLALMRKLAHAGSDHRKYLRQLPVIMDVTAPLYWWKETDQYKVGTVTNSCSTMHTIHKKPFSVDDFSMEDVAEMGMICSPVAAVAGVIDMLNEAREKFLETDDIRYWRIMIQTLPSSYNQKRTLSCNYEVLWNMVKARKNHKLIEWRMFCIDILAKVPYFKEIFRIEDENRTD